MELPPARARGRAHALRRPRSRRGLGRAAARRAANPPRCHRRRGLLVPVHLRLRRRLGPPDHGGEGASRRQGPPPFRRASTAGAPVHQRTVAAPGATASCSRSSTTIAPRARRATRVARPTVRSRGVRSERVRGQSPQRPTRRVRRRDVAGTRRALMVGNHFAGSSDTSS
jgi:hypothetical protein